MISKRFLIIIGMIFLLLALNIYVRTASYDTPVTDDIASSMLKHNLANAHSKEILKRVPNITQSEFDNYIKIAMSKEVNNANFTKLVRNLSDNIKSSYKDSEGNPYPLAVDPYYYYRTTKNLIEKGHTGEVMKDNVSHSYLQGAPQGVTMRPEMHSYYQATLYHAFKTLGFIDNIDGLFLVLYWSPIILICVLTIILFLMLVYLGNPLSSFLGTIIFTLHSMILLRTMGGFSDTDGYVILFPVLILSFIIFGMYHKKYLWKLTMYSTAGSFVGIFSFAWSGWWYTLVAVTGGWCLYYLLRVVIRSIKKKKLLLFFKDSTFLYTYIVSALLSIISLVGSDEMIKIIRTPFNYAKFKSAVTVNLFPNIYTTVSELRAGTFNDMVAYTAGVGVGAVMFCLMFIGLWILLYRGVEVTKQLKLVFFSWVGCVMFTVMFGILGVLSPEVIILILGVLCFSALGYRLWLNDCKTALFYSIVCAWLLLSIYASFKGVRFYMFLLLPYTIGITMLIDYLYRELKKFFNENMRLNKYLVTFLCVSVMFIVVLQPITLALKVSTQQRPIMDDTFYETLLKIKNASNSNAMIVSWWDFGHMFTSIAERRVIIDGGTQNRPQTYWVARFLSEQDDESSARILRMLSCSGNDVYTESVKHTNDSLLSMEYINDYIKYDKPIPDVAESLYRCVPPQMFVIASQDMIYKASVWGHFGLWNFNKADQVKSFANDKEGSILISPVPRMQLQGDKAVGDEHLKGSLFEKLFNQEPVDCYVPFSEGRTVVGEMIYVYKVDWRCINAGEN